jgi:hypothetical protein
MLLVWCLGYLLVMQCFRFEFGIIKITAVFVIIGIPLVWFAEKRKSQIQIGASPG